MSAPEPVDVPAVRPVRPVSAIDGDIDSQLSFGTPAFLLRHPGAARYNQRIPLISFSELEEIGSSNGL